MKIWIDSGKTQGEIFGVLTYFVILGQLISKISPTMVDILGAFLVILYQHISKISPTMVENSSAFLSSHFMPAYFKMFSNHMVDILGAFLVIFQFSSFLGAFLVILCQHILKISPTMVGEFKCF